MVKVPSGNSRLTCRSSRPMADLSSVVNSAALAISVSRASRATCVTRITRAILIIIKGFSGRGVARAAGCPPRRRPGGRAAAFEERRPRGRRCGRFAPYADLMGMMMAVAFERRGRLYYLDPGPHTPSIGDKVLVPTDSGPEVAECIWAPQWISDDIGGLPVCAGLATDEDLERDETNRRRRAECRIAAKRFIRTHKLPMKVTAVDYVDRHQRLHDLLQRPEPGRLPGPGPRPGRPAAGPGRTAPDRPARRGPAAGRHRAVRA